MRRLLAALVALGESDVSAYHRAYEVRLRALRDLEQPPTLARWQPRPGATLDALHRRGLADRYFPDGIFGDPVYRATDAGREATRALAFAGIARHEAAR